MKTGIILAILAVFMFSASAASADIVDDFAEVTGMTVQYVYDGYCDGATLNILSGKVTGVWNSPCATCPFTETLNGRTGRDGGVAAAGFKYTPDTYGIWTIVRADHTWTHYYNSGGVANQGTWTACPAANVAADAPPSI